MCQECCGCLTSLDVRELAARELEAIAEDIIKDGTGDVQQNSMIRAFVHGLAQAIREEPIPNTVDISSMSLTLTPEAKSPEEGS